jgi:hypothetical protein
MADKQAIPAFLRVSYKPDRQEWMSANTMLGQGGEESKSEGV